MNYQSTIFDFIFELAHEVLENGYESVDCKELNTYEKIKNY